MSRSCKELGEGGRGRGCDEPNSLAPCPPKRLRLFQRLLQQHLLNVTLHALSSHHGRAALSSDLDQTNPTKSNSLEFPQVGSTSTSSPPPPTIKLRVQHVCKGCWRGRGLRWRPCWPATRGGPTEDLRCGRAPCSPGCPTSPPPKPPPHTNTTVPHTQSQFHTNTPVPRPACARVLCSSLSTLRSAPCAPCAFVGASHRSAPESGRPNRCRPAPLSVQTHTRASLAASSAV